MRRRVFNCHPVRCFSRTPEKCRPPNQEKCGSVDAHSSANKAAAVIGAAPGMRFSKFLLTNNLDLRDTGAIGRLPHLTLAMEACKHPRVRVLTREEDAEFVECLECGEVFDSHEFTDMAIEEKSLRNIEQPEE